MTPQSTAEHYREQQRLTVATLAASRRVWRGMSADFDSSWRQVGPRLVMLATGAQFAAATQGVEYVPRVLAETDQPDRPEGDVSARAIAGVASDGRDLNSLLYGAVTTAKSAVPSSSNPQEALAAGGRWLDMAVQTVVADAARDAVSVGIAARPQISGYVRMLNLPSCSRCALLAGKFFRWNDGFLRHPRCDCRHIPASEDIADDFTTDPRKAIEAGQVRGLTRAERAAIDDGADIGQVINARRGMTTTRIGGRDIQVTTEGTTRRGVAFRALSNRGSVTESAGTATRITSSGPQERAITRTRARAPRLTPEAIYGVADGREDAIRLLRANGYLI